MQRQAVTRHVGNYGVLLERGRQEHAGSSAICYGNHRILRPRAVGKISSAIWRRIWIRFQGASTGAYELCVPFDATPKNGFKDKQDGGIYFFLRPYVYRKVDGRLIFSFFIRNLNVLGLRPRY